MWGIEDVRPSDIYREHSLFCRKSAKKKARGQLRFTYAIGNAIASAIVTTKKKAQQHQSSAVHPALEKYVLSTSFGVS